MEGFDKKFNYIYHAMRDRCNNPKHPSYKNYGGRGIKVLWSSFKEFKEDMYPSYLAHKARNKYTSIERTDNDKEYSKDNCRWATHLEQNRNTRSVRFIFHDGVRLSIPEWEEKLGMKRNTISDRLYKGFTEIEAITKKYAKRN